MNKKYKDIANQYEISEEQSHEILAGLKIENTSKNPSRLKLQGFESVCKLLKEGKDLGGAIAQVEEEVKQLENEMGQPEEEMMAGATDEIAKQIADAMYASVPGIAQKKFFQMQQGLEKGVEKFFVQNVVNGDFAQNFRNFVKIRNESGKLIEEELENSALPPENFENSALPPGQ